MHILTRSARQFSFVNPHPSMVVLDDVAHALSHINRFTGHTSYAYSVAQHSVAVSRYLERTGAPLKVQMAGLLHDAHEAYFGDIAAPLKAFLKVGDVEDRIQVVVATAFGLTLEDLHDRRVKLADLTALAVEATALMPPDTEDWPCLAPVTPAMCALMPTPYKVPPEVAKALFLNRYQELRARMGAAGTVELVGDACDAPLY
ncbi:hypothetical protein [Burkholderia ubonensis]|uniref:hypothetical protein n=1 Tax=Burkholderia ubonensis TaxID=101571 RepID=UPI0007569ABD|nr:hypothetical protein [Burkholderia ubonensis]